MTAVGDEKMTYIYVLYYEGDGHLLEQYYMDIYEVGRTATNSKPGGYKPYRGERGE